MTIEKEDIGPIIMLADSVNFVRFGNNTESAVFFELHHAFAPEQ